MVNINTASNNAIYKNMVHIYYGFGKGKTSTLNGSAIRALGAGFRPIIARFLKNRKSSENDLLIKIGIPVILSHPLPKFVIEMNREEKALAKQKARESFFKLKELPKKYNFICLDEAIDLVYLKFITQKEFINMLKILKQNAEVLISGHYEFKQIFNFVDLITYYDPKKHYFNKGVQARVGIEK